MLECTLGAYSARTLCDWEPPAGVCWDVAADELLDEPNVWTDGSLVFDEVSGFLHLRGLACMLGHVLMLGEVADGGTSMVLLLMVLLLLL